VREAGLCCNTLAGGGAVLIAGPILGAMPKRPSPSQPEPPQTTWTIYKFASRTEVVTIEEWMARRMQLWRRLDTLTRPGGGGQPEKQVR
jgi:hypothetical protein